MSFSAAFYRGEDAEIWNAFNAQARNGHFLFDRRFMDYHADRFTDASLLLSGEEGVAGLLPANVLGDTVTSHQGLTFGGLVVGATRLPATLGMLDAMAETYRSRGLKTLVYKPLPHIYHRRPSEDDLYWLTRNGARLVRRDASSTLAFTEPGPVSSRRRRGAEKAVKAGLAFARSEDWAGFWAVLEAALAERHGVRPVHSVAELVGLATALPEHIRLYTAAAADGQVLAGVVMFLNGPCAHAQYIAASPDGRSVGALDGLFGHIIETCRGAGFASFDFGISTEDQGRVLNEGLVGQKEEFGASTTVYDVYQLDL